MLDLEERFLHILIAIRNDRGRKVKRMDDLISRQDVFDEIRRVSGCLDNDMITRLYIELNMLPSTQPEIIRCKDCKYMTEHYDTDGNVPYWTCSEWDSGTDYDGFCHYAERRTDE